MLKNAPTLAIRGVDTAENEPTFEPMARAGSRADGFLRALSESVLVLTDVSAPNLNEVGNKRKQPLAGQVTPAENAAVLQ